MKILFYVVLFVYISLLLIKFSLFSKILEKLLRVEKINFYFMKQFLIYRSKGLNMTFGRSLLHEKLIIDKIIIKMDVIVTPDLDLLF